MWKLGKDIVPENGYWWVVMPTWEWPCIVYMAKLGNSSWRISTGIRTEPINPFMLFQKIENVPMPDESVLALSRYAEQQDQADFAEGAAYQK